MRKHLRFPAWPLAIGALLCACARGESGDQPGMLADREHAATTEDSLLAQSTRPLPGPFELPPWPSARDSVPNGMMEDLSQRSAAEALEAGKPIPAPTEPRGR